MTMTPDKLPICHPDTGFISVVGDEACAFLQSIITANVETLPIGRCRPTALLTPQGRVLIDMMVYRPASDHFLLRSDAARRDDLFTRLRRYRLRRPIDLTIEPNIRLVLLLGNVERVLETLLRDRRGQIVDDAPGLLLGGFFLLRGHQISGPGRHRRDLLERSAPVYRARFVHRRHLHGTLAQQFNALHCLAPGRRRLGRPPRHRDRPPHRREVRVARTRGCRRCAP